MGKTTNHNNGELPTAIVNAVNEHAIGGFAIFYFHPETGYPMHVLSFDSPAHALAMQKYILDWSEALRDLYIEGTRRYIEQNLSQKPSEEEPE